MDSSRFSSPPRSVESEAAIRSGTATSYRTKEGDLLGGNTRIPRGDFGAFLGYKPPTPEELSGQKQVSGGRVVELELEGMAPTWCMEIKYQLQGADGEPVEGVLHNTVHRLK